MPESRRSCRDHEKKLPMKTIGSLTAYGRYRARTCDPSHVKRMLIPAELIVRGSYITSPLRFCQAVFLYDFSSSRVTGKSHSWEHVRRGFGVNSLTSCFGEVDSLFGIPRDNFRGREYPFGMFYAHASKKCRQVFSFPGFPPTIAPISVGEKRQLSCFLPIEKIKLGGKQLFS